MEGRGFAQNAQHHQLRRSNRAVGACWRATGGCARHRLGGRAGPRLGSRAAVVDRPRRVARHSAAPGLAGGRRHQLDADVVESSRAMKQTGTRSTLGRGDEMRPMPHLRPGPDVPRAPGASTTSTAHTRAGWRAGRSAWAVRASTPTRSMQEVFLTVSRRREEFRGDAKLSTWLFRITRRVVANHRRAARRHSCGRG